MTTAYETHHTKNVDSFKDLFAFCIALGINYNPVNTSITRYALENKLKSAERNLVTINHLSRVLINAVSESEKLFADLMHLVARINISLASYAVSDSTLDDVKILTHKLQEWQSAPQKEEGSGRSAKEENFNFLIPQFSYHSQLETLSGIIELLSTLPGYKPNETDVSVNGLKALYTNIRSLNDTVVNTQSPIAHAREAINTELYHPETGFVAISNAVKDYVRTKFGYTSPQYQTVCDIVFV